MHSGHGGKQTAAAHPTGGATQTAGTETPTPSPSYDEVTADSFTASAGTNVSVQITDVTAQGG
ncbi:hypothetical protein ACFV2H_43300 [Streptomyces sp. NPDC059629]|uniref:hypothetical protein n=1 Tax=Streptomyces sp. NPDC059629 TaxID=3346889 RepID=UPI003680F4EF